MASYWDPIRKMLGCPDDAAAAGDGTVIAVLKRIRTLLGGPFVISGAVTIAAEAYTTPTHTSVNVTVASGVVLTANVNRLYALLINDSDTVVYIKMGAAAVVNQGIRLNASGGSYEMSALLGNLYKGAINSIHAGAGNKVLLILEGV